MGSLQWLTSAQSVSRIVSSSHGIGSNWLNRLKNQRDRLIALIEKHGDASQEALERGFEKSMRSPVTPYISGL